MDPNTLDYLGAPPQPWIANKAEDAFDYLVVQPHTVCVSITEPGRDAEIPAGFVATLRLHFEDVEHDDYRDAFNWKHAWELATFARTFRGYNFYIHCAAGLSRSGAVAEVLLEAFPEYEDRGWPRMPNGRVRAILKRAMGLVPLGADEA
jgi:predicted protein tyrosine phosphatase